VLVSSTMTSPELKSQRLGFWRVCVRHNPRDPEVVPAGEAVEETNRGGCQVSMPGNNGASKSQLDREHGFPSPPIFGWPGSPSIAGRETFASRERASFVLFWYVTLPFTDARTELQDERGGRQVLHNRKTVWAGSWVETFVPLRYRCWWLRSIGKSRRESAMGRKQSQSRPAKPMQKRRERSTVSPFLHVMLCSSQADLQSSTGIHRTKTGFTRPIAARSWLAR